MSAGAPTSLSERIRLMVLTGPEPACGRPLVEVARECVEAGATAIQLRDKTATAADLYRMALALRTELEAAGALFLVNDRLDVAMAAGAHGVHLGPADLPVGDARRVCPPGFVIGASTDDPAVGARLAAAGADYLGVGAVFGTVSKPGLADEAIGPGRVAEVRAAAGIPVVGIGGITPGNAAAVAAVGAGIAVLGAVMDAARPGDAVRELLAALNGLP